MKKHRCFSYELNISFKRKNLPREKFNFIRDDNSFLKVSIASIEMTTSMGKFETVLQVLLNSIWSPNYNKMFSCRTKLYASYPWWVVFISTFEAKIGTLPYIICFISCRIKGLVWRWAVYKTVTWCFVFKVHILTLTVQ